MITPEQYPEMVAHHEAGHAVAVVCRGGVVHEVRVGVTDPDDADMVVNWVRMEADPRDHPFAIFAGPWASAMWAIENDPAVSDFQKALDSAWFAARDDFDKYHAIVGELHDEAWRLGLGQFSRVWEGDWCYDLGLLWPAVCTVAAALLADETVTHEAIAAAIAAAGLDDEEAVA